MKLTDKQNKIIVDAAKANIGEQLTKGAPCPAFCAVTAHAMLSQKVSAARAAGASFEDLFCIIYGINGEEND
jgi:hypothetical protein